MAGPGPSKELADGSATDALSTEDECSARHEVEVLPLLSASPHVSEYQLTTEDKFVILACDGVWDVMSDQQEGVLAPQVQCCMRVPAHMGVQPVSRQPGDVTHHQD